MPRRVFLSYHHADQVAVNVFVRNFRSAFDEMRALGVQTTDDYVPPEDQLIDSESASYVLRRIREKYISGTSCTIVLIGQCTWARRYVDWEVAATLRNSKQDPRGGLVAITLPDTSPKRLPDRVQSNVDYGYSQWMKYPTSANMLSTIVEEAIRRRDSLDPAVNSTRNLRVRSSQCP
jgi:hypothetical protein